jgi:hypothetical protein
MSFKRVIFMAALALLAMPLASAQAWWRVGIGIGFPVYRPYPYRVYVAPAPVYVGSGLCATGAGICATGAGLCSARSSAVGPGPVGPGPAGSGLYSTRARIAPRA